MQVKLTFLRLILALIASGFAVSAGAAMYKWTDSEGNVHYTQTPPEEGEAAEIPPPPRVNPPATSDLLNGGATTGDRNTPEEKEAELSPEQVVAYQRNCEAAKANLELYKTSDRIKQADDGKVVAMDEELRGKKMQQAEEQIKKYCK
ncbi:MAG TPA: DUF4124 domain-containing protein [Gammaproteobacteria bacterium]